MDATLAHPRSAATAAQTARDSDPLHDVVRLLGGAADLPEAPVHAPVAVRRFAKDARLAHEGAPLRSVYVVRSGSLKCVRTREDGYEQVSALALPGDVLGFDGLHTGLHASTEVALEVSTVFVLPLSTLQALRERWPEMDDAWQRALSRQLARAVAIADMLSAVASDVRLARFILWLSARATELGWSPRRLRLTLCRRDIASLLGVAHETVSRSFTTMADAGLLKVDNREIEILDLAQLQARARITRRPAEVVSLVAPPAAAPPRVAPGRWSGMRHALATA